MRDINRTCMLCGRKSPYRRCGQRGRPPNHCGKCGPWQLTRRDLFVDLDNLFAVQRQRLSRQWTLAEQRIQDARGASSVYTVEQRGFTYGGAATRTEYQVQE